MKVVLQRVANASVTAFTEAGAEKVSQIEGGLLILVGVSQCDTEEDARYLASKVAHLRVFEDEAGKLNRSLLDVSGSALVISNFTLYADCRKGRRPSFTEAASGLAAKSLYEAFGAALAEQGVPVQYGVFGAIMQVALINDGPITLILESRQR